MLRVAVLALPLVERICPLGELFQILNSECSLRVYVDCRRLDNLLVPCHAVANLYGLSWDK